MPHPNQLAPPGALFHLARDQARRHLPSAPHLPPSTSHFSPLPKMSWQSREGHMEAITGEERNAARCQDLWQGMDDAMCHVLGSRTQMEDGREARVQGSMASQSHSTCLAQRSLVRRSSTCRCGSRRWKKKRLCKVCACSPARVSQVMMVACREPKTREAADGSSPSASARSAARRSAAREFSNGTRESRVEHGTWCGSHDLETSGCARHGHASHPRAKHEGVRL
jgi:hypothetical protein